MNYSEGRKEGVHHLLNVSEIVFAAEKFQCVDLFLACELRSDIELLWHLPFVVIDAPALKMRSC